MSATTHSEPRYYGGLFNLEHRVMSGAVVALSIIVLVLVGENGRQASEGLEITAGTPAAAASYEQSDKWVRPAEIQVKTPNASLFVGDLDEWLLTPVRLVRPPQPAVTRMDETAGMAGNGEPTSTPARPAAVRIDPPAVAGLRLGELLVPAPLQAPGTSLSESTSP